MSMLEGAPWLVAHRSMLPINQPFKVSLYGKDYVIWQDSTGQISSLSNVCPHMGAMLSEGWCNVQADGSSNVVCPFHALEFDHNGCTILPGTKQKTLPQLESLELMIQGDFIWSYGNCEPKIPIPNVLEKIAQEYEFIGATADTSVETDLRSMLTITIIRMVHIETYLKLPKLDLKNSLITAIIPKLFMTCQLHQKLFGKNSSNLTNF
jgi:phenylpropionate dioxygenase-like ring-hydroxylating dioxygenase large terminal subunit